MDGSIFNSFKSKQVINKIKNYLRIKKRNIETDKSFVNSDILESYNVENLETIFMSSKTPSKEIENLILNPKIKNLIRSGFSIQGIPTTFFGDSLITFGKNLSFLSDTRFLCEFKRALECYEEKQERPILEGIIWRANVFNWAAQSCLPVEGDFIEAGCHYGFRVDISSHYINFNKVDKTWFLYDTFEGVPQDQIDPGFSNPESYSRPGTYQLVRKKFSEFNNIRVVKGRIPEILDKVSPKKVAFLHLDLNNSTAEKQTIQILFDRISDGGIVLLDDYGWHLFKKQKEILDKEMKSFGYPILELPTGQGIIIKHKDSKYIPNFDININSSLKSWPDKIEITSTEVDSAIDKEIEEAERYRQNQLRLLKEQLHNILPLLDKVNLEDNNRLKHIWKNGERIAERLNCHIYKRVGERYFGRYVVDNIYDNAKAIRELIQQDIDELTRILDMLTKVFNQ